MIEPALRASEAKTLDQQKTDFTAEGAPPPEKSKATVTGQAVRVARVVSNGPVTTPVPPIHPDWAHTRPAARP